MGIWSVFEGYCVSLLVDAALAYAAFSFLGEYRKLFMTNPKSAMSVEGIDACRQLFGWPGLFGSFSSCWLRLVLPGYSIYIAIQYIFIFWLAKLRLSGRGDR